MISTKGLELTNFINPDLTWKTVSKGYRSATRRSRKQLDRSPKSDADLPDKGTESPTETTVSESEKLGVAVLGQRFSDQIEHVPIKKRRFTIRSSSPQRYISPIKKDRKQLSEDNKSCQKSVPKKVDGSTRRRKANQICIEDFSGIEILAAAACNDDMGNDTNCEESLVVEKSSQVDREKSITGLHLEESISLKETTHIDRTDSALDGKEIALLDDADANHKGTEDSQRDARDDKTVENSLSSRDVRLHWDLNLEMEAWETPCETDSRTEMQEVEEDEKLEGSEACELKESREIAGDIVAPDLSVTDQAVSRGELSFSIDENEEKCSLLTDNAVKYALKSSSPCLSSKKVKAPMLSEGTPKALFLLLAEKKKKVEKDGNAVGVQLSNDVKVDGGAACKVEKSVELAREMTISHNSHHPAIQVNRVTEEVGITEEREEVPQKSAVSQNSSVEKGSSKNLEIGYDSQYEDGELRECDAPPPYWEEVDYEECVDYGSDTCDDAAAAAASFSTSNKPGVQVECSEEEFRVSERSVDVHQIERVFGSGFDGVCEHGDALRQKPVGSKMKGASGSEVLSRGSETSPSRIAEEVLAGEGCVIVKHTNSLDSFDGKDSLAKVASPKDFPGIVSLAPNDSTIVQSRSSNLDFCSVSDEARADHFVGQERFDLQIHPKSPAGPGPANPSVNYWDSRRRDSSPNFRGPFGPDRSRARDSCGGYGMHPEEGADSYSHGRQTMNSFSNGSYRYPVRRRSPVNRDRGMLPMRDESPDRRRFRRYPQGGGRGFRDYNNNNNNQQRPLPPPLNDSDEYSSRIVRRDQNSPGLGPNRGPVYFRRPFKRSPSRSRSRSPGGWISSRDQHRNSRSPDYRFEPRMQRMRVPFQKQNFGPKYEAGFVSPQRRRFSPQHMNNNSNNNNNNSRWFNDQNGGGGGFRGRRVPARPFQQGHRFDSSEGSSRRMNSDDYYEPAMRPVRFSGERGRGRGGAGRGGGGHRRYDSSDDDRRRPDNNSGGRYDMYQRVKRCDTEGGLRRNRFDEEDNSFASRNSNNFNDSDNNNNNNNDSGGERRPRNVFMGAELAKRKPN